MAITQVGTATTQVVGTNAASQNIVRNGVGAGNQLILFALWDTAGSVPTLSVSGGGTWPGSPEAGGAAFGNTAMNFWYLSSATGGNTTVTVSSTINSDPGSAGGATLWLSEWTGLGTRDQTSGATPSSGTGTTATSPTITPTASGELVIMAMAGGVPSASPGAPWTNETGPSWYGSNQAPLAWQVAAGTTGLSCTWTRPSGSWATIGMSIFAASAAAAGPQFVPHRMPLGA